MCAWNWITIMSTGFGIYIHTPWCRVRCPYCAFNVFLADKADYPQWEDAIRTAWAASEGEFEGRAHSLYFGGGTPSLAPPDVIARLIASMPLQRDAEVTLEANPGYLDQPTLKELVDAGVNRLSVGVQTFNRAHAKRLGRGHTVTQTRELLGHIPSLELRSWSADLIFALPDQTLAQLDADLDALLAANPPHVSLYGLSIEPGTPFAELARQGRLTLPEEERWGAMYARIVDRLGEAGLERYEVSNFAQPGHRAVHNGQVWRGGHYAGLGPGAHGFLPSGERTLGHPTFEDWLADPVPVRETPSPEETALDMLLSTLRHVDGLHHALLQRSTGFEIDADVLADLIAHRLITTEAGHIRLTEASFPIADGIVRRIADALVPTV
jgi:putative oxygen-independent coproporphyrinogen III oxidase